jgi:hypothetical protein
MSSLQNQVGTAAALNEARVENQSLQLTSRNTDMRTKEILRTGIVAVATGAFMASGVYADQITLGYGSVYSGNGGEFLVTPDTSGSAADVAVYYSPLTKSGSGWETFCIEYNEHFYPGNKYYYQVTPDAIKGGQLVNDPVSPGTAYLYGLFAKGNLTGYNYSSSTSAGNLQNTIWFLEGEVASDPGTFDALLIAEFGSVAASMADTALSTHYGTVNAASFGVQALNLSSSLPSDSNPWEAQDQLIYQGGGFQTLPDGGATLMLLGLSLGGLAMLRRKVA